MKHSNNVLVTGSSRGIGASIAKILAQSGFNVILHGRDEAKLKEVMKNTGAVGYFAVDLCAENACESLIEMVKEKFGPVDVLVNNAGAYVWAPVEKTTDKDVDLLLKLNSKAPFRLIRAVVPEMKAKNYGRIVNIGSISGAVGEANASLYSLTKSAFSGMTKALALELACGGITINTINPGWVDTELAESACNADDGGFSKDENLEMIPQRRFIHPDEVGELVKYLVSDGAKGLTGQCINLCAGLSVG